MNTLELLPHFKHCTSFDYTLLSGSCPSEFVACICAEVNLLCASVQKWTLALLHACQSPFIRLRPPLFPWSHHVCISAGALCDLPGTLHTQVCCLPSGHFLCSFPSSIPFPWSLLAPQTFFLTIQRTQLIQLLDSSPLTITGTSDVWIIFIEKEKQDPSI